MTTYDPSTALRRLESGYKGDGWIVSGPAESPDPTLLLDTGLDSVAIVRIPDTAWDRGSEPLSVHAHAGYDESVLVPRGSGTLYHGPDADHIATSRFDGPVVLVFPAGAWHHIVMDPGVVAVGTGFFTVPGTVIEPFSVQMEVVTRGKVTFGDLSVVHPRRVDAMPWTAPLVATAGAAARLVDGVAADATPAVRILPYEPPVDGYKLPLDTGHDSLFIMASFGGPGVRQADFQPPDVVDVHRHPDVDEYILRVGGAGYLLNGPTLETVTLTPFRGPCLIVMPAGAFHRIVQTDDVGGDSILIYADRRAVVERYEVIMARTSVASLVGSPGHGSRP